MHEAGSPRYTFGNARTAAQIVLQKFVSEPAPMSLRATYTDRRHPERAYSRTANYAPPELVAQVSERLRKVCAHLPGDEFAELMQRIAHIQWKYDRRGDPDSLGRHVTQAMR